MSDPMAGKYHKMFSEEFTKANERLKSFHGELCWSKNDYEAFTFKAPGLSLIFYPHRTKSNHQHIRVRDASSKDKNLFVKAVRALNQEEPTCTFHVKNSSCELLYGKD